MKKILILLLSGLMVSAGTPVYARTWPRKTTIPKGLPKNGEFVTAIGDSVMMGAQAGIHKVYPKMVIDTQVSRQANQAVKFLKQMKARHALGNYVVVGLGTNGHLSTKIVNNIRHYLGNRQVYWVTNYNKGMSYTKNNSKLIASMSKKYKNLHAVRWDQYIVKHKNYLGPDQCHMRPQYGDKYAHLLDPYIKYIGKSIDVTKTLSAKTPQRFAQKFYLKKDKQKGFDYVYQNDQLTIKRLKGEKTVTDFTNKGYKPAVLWKMQIGDEQKKVEKALKKARFNDTPFVKKSDSVYTYNDEGTLTLTFRHHKLTSYSWKLRPVTEEA